MSDHPGGAGNQLKQVFADPELAEGAVIRSFRMTAADGKLMFIDASHDNDAGKHQTFKELGHE